jgi:hypothetical protein
MQRLIAAIFSLTLSMSFVGCASSVVPSGVNILVAITNPFPGNLIQVGAAPATLNAAVTYDGLHKGVTWTLTTANIACSPACGTLVPTGDPSFSAVYTPPATTPLNQQATIAAVSNSDNRQEFAFTFTIIPPASVQITNKFMSVLNGSAPIQVNAAVMNDPANAGVTWTLTAGGSSCSPACGTLVPGAAPVLSAVYTPPATFPTASNANPTITATSVTNTSASDSFTFAILSSASLLKGNYTFLLRGYDGNALPMSLVGVIVADGNGKITGGEVDVNDDGGVTAIPAPQTGTYSIQVSPTGITQALFEISSFTFPGSTNDLKFRCFLSSDGKHGRIIELDGSGYINAGTIELQDTSAIAAKPAGNFAFGVDSDAPFAGRTIAAGQLVLGAAGVTGGLIDLSVAAAAAPTFVAQPLTAGAQSDPDALGRGTLIITASGKSVQYAYYIVDSSHFLLLEIDRGLVFGTVFAGVARSQSGLTADSVNGVNVIQLTGFDEPTGTSTVQPVVLVGLLTVFSGNSYDLTFDINDLGNILTRHGANGSVTFDTSTGRAVLSAPDGFGSNFVNAGAWYLYDKGKGFFVEEDPSTPSGTPPAQSVTNRALSGTTLPQTGAPYKVSDLTGNAIAGFGAASSPLVPNAELGINFTNSSVKPTSVGNYSALGDVTSVPTQGANVPNVQFTGIYRLVDASLGYGGIQFPAPLFGDFSQVTGTNYSANFYMVAPHQFVSVGTQLGILSGVIFVDPQ